jgi:hypothetical protein
MIPSLHISGFKVFRDIKLPRLGSLNLFVGKNNTGKTCLLEAVELYASSSRWEVLQIASRREAENAAVSRAERVGIFDPSPFVQPLMNLFHRRKGIIPQLQIRLSANNEEADLELRRSGIPVLASPLDQEIQFRDSGTQGQGLQQTIAITYEAEGFQVSRGKAKQGRIFSEHSLQKRSNPDAMLAPSGWLHPDAAPVAYLPARGLANGEAKRLWDNAQLADKDDLLVSWLRLIEPEARDVTYIGDSGSGVGVPYLKINGDRGRSPLGSMGDGLTRLFHIGLAMVNASGGILLIDEFENGLHWEVQEQLWKALFEAANQFGVQVFATTHSNDCIRAFMDAQNSRLIPSESFVYRLERSGDDVYALELPSENLNAALRQQVEVR